jgi:hypothetical protein
MTMGMDRTLSEKRRSCLLVLVFCGGINAVLVLTFDQLKQLTLVEFVLVLAAVAAGSAALWKIVGRFDKEGIDWKLGWFVVWPMILLAASGFWFCVAAVLWRTFAWLWP